MKLRQLKPEELTNAELIDAFAATPSDPNPIGRSDGYMEQVKRHHELRDEIMRRLEDDQYVNDESRKCPSCSKHMSWSPAGLNCTTPNCDRFYDDTV